MEAFYFYLERENGKFLKSHLNVFYLSLKQAHTSFKNCPKHFSLKIQN